MWFSGIRLCFIFNRLVCYTIFNVRKDHQMTKNSCSIFRKCWSDPHEIVKINHIFFLNMNPKRHWNTNIFKSMLNHKQKLPWSFIGVQFWCFGLKLHFCLLGSCILQFSVGKFDFFSPKLSTAMGIKAIMQCVCTV